MALPSLSDLVTGLERRLRVEEGSLEDQDLAAAEEALTDAAALVSATGGIWATGGDDDAPAAAVAVLMAVAKRTYLNTTGAETESTGPFAVKWGSAWLTTEERRVLGSLGGSTGGLWSLSTTRGDDLADAVYVDVVESEPFPLYAPEDAP
jgi:hypothetical protein